MADEKLEIDITAKDDASKVVDQLQGKVDKLEKSDPKVDVKADADKAENEVDSFAKKLAKLGDADQVVVLALRAGQAQTELTQLATDIARLDATDPDIDIKLEHYAEVAADLDQLETKMKDIASTSIDPDLEGKAQARLRGIGDEAAKTEGAVHSMAGNALGDFAATTSGIGPLGEAIGQLTEMASAGEASMSELATAGLGLGAISAGMFIVQTAMAGAAEAAAKFAALDKFKTDDVEAFTKAMSEGKNVTDDYLARLRELGKVNALVTPTFIDMSAGIQKAMRQVIDIAPLLHDAGISAENFAKAATGGAADYDRFASALANTNLTLEQQQLIMAAVNSEFDNMAAAEENHRKFTDVFGDQTKQVNLFNQATQEMRNKLVGAGDAAGKFADKIGDGVRGLRDMTGAYQKLSDEIAGDQAWIDLADQIDNVTEAGGEAMTAQAEADKARASGAKDAADKQRDADQAMRDYRTQINQTKDDIINLAATAGANPVQLKAALDKVDQGDLNGAKADAEAWSKRNPVVLTAELRVALIKALGSGLGPAIVVPGSATQSAPTTNVTQFLAVPDARRQAVAAQRSARVNGRR